MDLELVDVERGAGTLFLSLLELGPPGRDEDVWPGCEDNPVLLAEPLVRFMCMA